MQTTLAKITYKLIKSVKKMYVITDLEFKKMTSGGGVFENFKCHNPNCTANCRKGWFY
jgi:hypothetical protein